MIEHFNPWWRGRFEDDEDYRKWKESEIKWIPKEISEISLDSFSLNFLFGPRQVGKTTLLKLLIKKLLDEGVDPMAVFYLRCDYIEDYKELINVLDEYFEMREVEGIESSYIFLDEITFPREWFRAIKLYVDMGKFRNDVLVLTGSVSMYLKGEVETFPGRRGKGKDIIMYPLSFREFVRVASPEVYKNIPRVSDPFEADECIDAKPWTNELRILFSLYLKSGGFPRAVKDVLKSGRVSEETYETYLAWVRGDILRLGKSEWVVKRIIKAILEKAPSPLGWNTLAKEIDVGSHKTVFRYIEFLEKAFIVKVLPYLDPNTLEPNYKKEKKVHLTDPFLYHLFSKWCLVEEPGIDKIVEGVVASHLARRYEVGYWRNSSEIDIVTREGVGFEVKWRKNPGASKAYVGKIREVITLSKEGFSRDPLMIPAYVFLACFDV